MRLTSVTIQVLSCQLPHWLSASPTVQSPLLEAAKSHAVIVINNLGPKS
jgi:hypothetical protein